MTCISLLLCKIKSFFLYTLNTENYLTFYLISACSNPPFKFLNGFLYDSHFSPLSFMYKMTHKQYYYYISTRLCLPYHVLNFFADFITNDSRIFFLKFSLKTYIITLNSLTTEPITFCFQKLLFFLLIQKLLAISFGDETSHIKKVAPPGPSPTTIIKTRKK